MSETTATVTCWRLRLNLIVIGWKINCLLKHFTIYTLHSGQVWGLIWTKLQEAIFWTYFVVNRCFLGTIDVFRHFPLF